MRPGTANTSRPWLRACPAVMSEPLYSSARTTSTPRDSPEMMRLRMGKFPGRAGSPTGYSVRTAPFSAISSRRGRVPLG